MSTIIHGKASIKTEDLDSFYTSFLDKVAPNARKVIDSSLEKIENQARAQWPKRKKNSQGSYRRFIRGYRIDPSGNLIGYLKNTAPYSWAIKFGLDSENYQSQDLIYPTGKRVSQELLVRPLRQESKHVINALADDLARGAGNG